ncbi:hypothetical protein COPEUT_02225 [Coprococcus eutactus ATCC 27759]|nr:hypothetical protein COPEUT_02225 [Coprococcus eutactus ATCC 27759]
MYILNWQLVEICKTGVYDDIILQAEFLHNKPPNNIIINTRCQN